MESAINFALKKAGVVELNEKQKERCSGVFKGHDVFGSLPTGYENL